MPNMIAIIVVGLALLTGIVPVHYAHTDHFVDSCDDL